MSFSDRRDQQGSAVNTVQGVTAVQGVLSAAGAAVSAPFSPVAPVAAAAAAAPVITSAAEIGREYHKLLDVVGTPNYETIQRLFEGNGVPPASTVPAIQVSFELFEAVQGRFAATKQVLERTKTELLTRNQHYSTLKQDMARLKDEYTVLQKRSAEAEERNTQLHQQRAKLEVAVEQLGREVGQGRAALDALRSKLLQREEELQLSQSRVAEGLVLLSQKEAVIATLRRELGKGGPLRYGSAGHPRDGARDGGGDGGNAQGFYTADMLSLITADVEGRSQEARMKLSMTDLEGRLTRLSEERDSILAQHTEYRRHVQIALESYEAEAMLREDTMATHQCFYSPYFAGEQQEFYAERINLQTGELWSPHTEGSSGKGSAAAVTGKSQPPSPPNFNALSVEIRRVMDRLSKVHIDDASRLQPGLLLCVDAQHMALKASAGLVGFLSTMEDEVLRDRVTLKELREEWHKARVPEFAQTIAQSLQESTGRFRKALVHLLQNENNFVTELEGVKASEQRQTARSSMSEKHNDDADADAAAVAVSTTGSKERKQGQGKRTLSKSGLVSSRSASASRLGGRHSLSSTLFAGDGKPRGKSLIGDGSVQAPLPSLSTAGIRDGGSSGRGQGAAPIASEVAHAAHTEATPVDPSQSTAKGRNSADSTNQRGDADISSTTAMPHNASSPVSQSSSVPGADAHPNTPRTTTQHGYGDQLNNSSGSAEVADEEMSGVTGGRSGRRGDLEAFKIAATDAGKAEGSDAAAASPAPNDDIQHTYSPTARPNSKMQKKRGAQAGVAEASGKKSQHNISIDSPCAAAAAPPSKPSLPPLTGRASPRGPRTSLNISKPGGSSSVSVLDEREIPTDPSKGDVGGAPLEVAATSTAELQFALSDCQERLLCTMQELQDLQMANDALKAQLAEALAAAEVVASTPGPLTSAGAGNAKSTGRDPNAVGHAANSATPPAGVENSLVATRSATALGDVVGYSVQKKVASQSPTASSGTHSDRRAASDANAATDREVMLAPGGLVEVDPSAAAVNHEPYLGSTPTGRNTLLRPSPPANGEGCANASAFGAAAGGHGGFTRGRGGNPPSRQAFTPSPVSISLSIGSRTVSVAPPSSTSNTRAPRPGDPSASRFPTPHSQHSKWVLSDHTTSSSMPLVQDDAAPLTALRGTAFASLQSHRPEAQRQTPSSNVPPTTAAASHHASPFPITALHSTSTPATMPTNSGTAGAHASTITKGRGDSHASRPGGRLMAFKSLATSLTQSIGGPRSSFSTLLQPLSITNLLSQPPTCGGPLEPAFSFFSIPTPALPAIAVSEDRYPHRCVASVPYTTSSAAAVGMTVWGSSIYPSNQISSWSSAVPQESVPMESPPVSLAARTSPITTAVSAGVSDLPQRFTYDSYASQAAMSQMMRQELMVAYQQHRLLFTQGASPLYINSAGTRTIMAAKMLRDLQAARRRRDCGWDPTRRMSTRGGLCHLMTRPVRGAWMRGHVGQTPIVASPMYVRAYGTSSGSNAIGGEHNVASYTSAPCIAAGRLVARTSDERPPQWPQLFRDVPFPALLMYLATPDETRRRWGATRRGSSALGLSALSAEATKSSLPHRRRPNVLRTWRQQRQWNMRRLCRTPDSSMLTFPLHAPASECVLPSPVFGCVQMCPPAPVVPPQYTDSLFISGSPGKPADSMTFDSLIISPLTIYPRKEPRHIQHARQWAKRDPTQRAVKRTVYAVSATGPPLEEISEVLDNAQQ